MKVVAIAGGVGGAKLADGLAQVLSPSDLTVIVNTGDDFEHWGLRVSPDLDTVCYTLAGMANPLTGWGRENETWNVYEAVKKLEGEDWFHIGDRDLGTHIERTRLLNQGLPLSKITAQFCAAWGVQARIIPMTDDPLSTWVRTVEKGLLPFQEYFVKNTCQPVVTGFEFKGAETAMAAPGIVEAIQSAEAIVICPSNPWVSVGPIMAIHEIREALAVKTCVVAVSPIIGGHAVKGPAAKMYTELGIKPSAFEVARQYKTWIQGFILDEIDLTQRGAISDLGLKVMAQKTLMLNREDRADLARQVLDFCETIQRGEK